MAIFGVSNQLLQIDTGLTRTYLYNSTTAFAPWAGLGENQVLGQRYFGVTNTQVPNANSSPAIFMLVQYLSMSAITTANLTTAAAPAPVYWTDNTFTTVTGITTEGIGGTTLGLAFPAGFLMPNTVSLTSLTGATLVGSLCLIQVAGYLKGAYMSSSSNAGIGAWIVPSAGTLSSAFIAAGSAATYQPFGRQLTALSSGLCDVLVGCDII
jgi:hypothetical protein